MSYENARKPVCVKKIDSTVKKIDSYYLFIKDKLLMVN